MVVIRSFPFGCITDHVDAVISTSSYREAESCGVVRRRADSFGPPDGVGARSDIQDIFKYMREVPACVVSDGTVHLPNSLLSVGVKQLLCPEHRFLDRMRLPLMKVR